MKLTIKIAAATIALLLTVAIVENIVSDKGQASSPLAWTLTHHLNLDAPVPSSTGSGGSDATHYRVTTTAKTATDLGQNREGCTLTAALPPEATCEIAIAFPDIGLNGTVAIVGSDRSSSNDTLTFKVDD